MDEVNHVNCCLVFVVLSLVTLVTFDIVLCFGVCSMLSNVKVGCTGYDLPFGKCTNGV